MIALGILRVHNENVGNDEKTEFTICNLPTKDRNIDVDDSRFLIFWISGMNEDMFGLVIPMGKLKYVNRRVPMLHLNVFARMIIFSASTLIGYMLDF